MTGIRKQAHPVRPAFAKPGTSSEGWSPATPPARRAGDEIRAPATLVEAIHTRSRTRVRFPPSPLTLSFGLVESYSEEIPKHPSQVRGYGLTCLIPFGFSLIAGEEAARSPLCGLSDERQSRKGQPATT